MKMIERLVRAYEAFNQRDIESVLELMHPKVEWPNGLEGGLVVGHDGVRSYWARQWGMIDPTVNPVTLKSLPDGRIYVLVRQIVKNKQGKVLLDTLVGHIYTLEEGLIVRMEIDDQAYAEDELRRHVV